MGSGLGRPIGLGRTAEVFDYGDDLVVKLLYAGMPEVMGEREATIATAVDQAGVAAPRFHGTTRIDGRFGLIYDRLDGSSMLDRIGQHPLELDTLAQQFAVLHASMHDTEGSGLPGLHDELRRLIGRAGDHLPAPARTAALSRLGELPEGSALCHGDMHPGNVLLTARGPVVIDWMTASSGNPAADVARTLFLLRDSSIPASVPWIQRRLLGMARRRFASTYLRHYRTHRVVADVELAAWRLPILAARLGDMIDEEQPTLLGMIERELRRAAATRRDTDPTG